ncbi:MAG: c-type cytochrome [Anaerolineae bacterium]|nr:c-type cytochrome [Anaerolineae bacterium]
MIPAERPVALDVTSDDVQHSFWVPEWGGKVDAIPGRVNTMWFDFHETASLFVRCAEYCGKSHYDMIASVEIIPGDEFDAWMADQVAHHSEREVVGADLDTPLPEGDAAAGEGVFLSQGCETCHAHQDSAGPALDGLGEAAAARREGYTADLYLHEAVVQPCAYLVQDYPCIMPEEYGERLTAQELADLLAYLLQR